MKITTIVCEIAAALMASLCLSPGLAPEAWAQTKLAATDTAPEAPAPLAVTARGAWSPSVNYVKDDLVTSRGSAWRARRANINKVPGSTSPSTAPDWERFAAGFNPLGAWLSTTTYHRDDLVLRLGSTWRARRTNLNVAPGLSPPDWQQFAAQGAPGGNSVGNGSAGAPSINFASDPSTGIFSPSTGKIAMTAGGALFLHNIGTASTALGDGALDSSTGSNNTAMGTNALTANTDGFNNTAVGSNALSSNTTGLSNTALGRGVLSVNSTGFFNTAIGAFALENNTSGDRNIVVGSNALRSNTTGASNVAVGAEAMFANTTGISNTAVGPSALSANTTGNSNTAVGTNALLASTNSSDNTAVGRNALSANTTGSNNIAVGRSAGLNPTAPTNGIFIGNQGLAGDTNTIKIGTVGSQLTAFVAGIAGVAVSNSAGVLIDTTTGQLGTLVSSRRYKEDIEPMGDASAALMKLRPVTFRYKMSYVDGPKPLEYGLIAEEVAEVLPDLAVFNRDGSPETVKYHLLPSLLLNEVQGQQRTIERQERTIQSQAEQIAALERRLNSLEAALRRPGAAAGLTRPVSLTRATR